MGLPTEKSPAQPRMGKVFIYGEPKIAGKSTIAATLDPDHTILLDVEDGLSAIEGFKHRITSWGNVIRVEGEGRAAQPVLDENSFRGTIAMLHQQRGEHPFKVGVIDTADALSQLCAEYVLASLGAGADRAGQYVHASDFEWGKGWDAIKTEWSLRVGALCRVLPNVIFISHANRVTKTDRIGAEVSVYTSNLGPKGLRAWTLGFVDHILFATVEQDDQGDDVHCVHTQPGRGWEAGGRTVAGGPKLPEPIWLPEALTAGATLKAELEKVSTAPSTNGTAAAAKEAEPKPAAKKAAAKKAAAKKDTDGQGELGEAA